MQIWKNLMIGLALTFGGPALAQSYLDIGSSQIQLAQKKKSSKKIKKKTKKWKKPTKGKKNIKGKKAGTWKSKSKKSKGGKSRLKAKKKKSGKGLKAKTLIKKKSKKAKTKRIVKKKPESSNSMLWMFLGFLVIAGAGIGGWFAHKKNRQDRLGFNFMESDVNRGAESKAHAKIPSQPATGISQAGAKKAVPHAKAGQQNYDPRMPSPFTGIACELNFKDPTQDHGRPGAERRKTA
jgi:hypothetical protein